MHKRYYVVLWNIPPCAKTFDKASSALKIEIINDKFFIYNIKYVMIQWFCNHIWSVICAFLCNMWYVISHYLKPAFSLDGSRSIRSAMYLFRLTRVISCFAFSVVLHLWVKLRSQLYSYTNTHALKCMDLDLIFVVQWCSLVWRNVRVHFMHTAYFCVHFSEP